MLKVFLIGLLGLASLLSQPGDPNPHARISSPGSGEALRGAVIVRGSANLPGQIVHFLEAQSLPDNTTPPDPAGLWLPVTLPSETLILNGVLGVWSTQALPDGFYALRLTIVVRQAAPVRATISPLLLANNHAFQPRPTLSGPADDAAPTVTALADVDLRAGSDMAYPAAGRLREGDSAPVLGRGGGWFYVQPETGPAGWVPADAVLFSGSFASVPPQTPPPLPTHPPEAASETPGQPNLLVSSARLLRETPRCNEPYTLLLILTNTGDASTGIAGLINIEDRRSADGRVLARGYANFPVLYPGQSWITTAQVTVNAYYAEPHQIVIRLDSLGEIPESSEADNTYTLPYTLAQANCP